MHQSFGFIFDGATHKHPNRRSWAPFRVYTTSMIIPFSIRIYFGHCLFSFSFWWRPLAWFCDLCRFAEDVGGTNPIVSRNKLSCVTTKSGLAICRDCRWWRCMRSCDLSAKRHFVLLLLSQSLWLIQQKASKLWWPEYCFQLASVVFTICLSRDPFARASVDRRLAFLIFFWNKLGSMR